MSFWRLAARATEQQERRVSRPTSTRLSGRWLTLIRFAWLVLIVCILAYFLASLPAIFVTAHQPCVGRWCTNATGRLTASQMHALVKAGISLDAYAWSFLLFTGNLAIQLLDLSVSRECYVPDLRPVPALRFCPLP